MWLIVIMTILHHFEPQAFLSITIELWIIMKVFCSFHVFIHVAAQMWNLATYLPLLIGDRVPHNDNHWECYLLLLDILQLCTTKSSSAAHAGILEALIYDHHHQFISNYPGATVIPKMHYMVHFPCQIIRYNIYNAFYGPVAYLYFYVAILIRMSGERYIYIYIYMYIYIYIYVQA